MTARWAFALGIDPGPTSGVALLHLDNVLAPRHKAPCGKLGGCAEVYQCNEAALPWLLASLLGDRGIGGAPCRAQGEAFARGLGPGARQAAGRKTADAVERVTAICAAYGVPLAGRNAGTVKPWAEGNGCKRLRLAGLLALVPGMPHAKSALSHALYCAVADCGYPDPASRAMRNPASLREEDLYAPGSG